MDCLEQAVTCLGINQIQHHLFLCADQTKPLCCDLAVGLESWNYLKQRLRELGLDRPQGEPARCIYRTKANCLRVCQQGPILLIYPDGVWYHSATPPVIEQILQEHLLEGKIVRDYCFAQAPLGPEIVIGVDSSKHNPDG
ncbi:ferredoxin [Candidatus Synechococcus calcipolaris G9]|uniref:Ferredoxin n=1 Tax=Candidatus Synechococcus calcipolaris G9 TaxID=1497997 RepID=A0ABT6F0T8_9SYNE|nr:ferredoxin [Candidatus Synechococcus calcipolaris]MDG2991442.1 ferredoxin [Candidatus Synechococcus calcipolaris G9]